MHELNWAIYGKDGVKKNYKFFMSSVLTCTVLGHQEYNKTIVNNWMV